MTTRRDFVKQMTCFSLAQGTLFSMLASGCSRQEKPLPFKISLAEWSLHRTLGDGGLDHLDFARTAKKDYGIEAVEYVNTFFFDQAKNQDYLRDMKRRAEDHGVRSLLIMCDREGDLGDPDRDKRQQAVENHYKWVEAAKYLGCHSIRVNARSAGNWADQLKWAADGLRQLADFAKPYDINVIVENHGGLSSNGTWLFSLIEMVGRSNCGTLPDFGNFRIDDEQTFDRYKGVEMMLPFAKGVSAKSYDFDADGNETTIDYERMLKIVVYSNYHGYVGIEYEGSRLSEPDGIRATKRLLERMQKKYKNVV